MHKDRQEPDDGVGAGGGAGPPVPLPARTLEDELAYQHRRISFEVEQKLQAQFDGLSARLQWWSYGVGAAAIAGLTFWLMQALETSSTQIVDVLRQDLVPDAVAEEVADVVPEAVDDAFSQAQRDLDASFLIGLLMTWASEPEKLRGEDREIVPDFIDAIVSVEQSFADLNDLERWLAVRGLRHFVDFVAREPDYPGVLEEVAQPLWPIIGSDDAIVATLARYATRRVLQTSEPRGALLELIEHIDTVEVEVGDDAFPGVVALQILSEAGSHGWRPAALADRLDARLRDYARSGRNGPARANLRRFLAGLVASGSDIAPFVTAEAFDRDRMVPLNSDGRLVSLGLAMTCINFGPGECLARQGELSAADWATLVRVALGPEAKGALRPWETSVGPQ